MNRYLLDTSALLALRDDEPGAHRVNAILLEAGDGTATVHACFMSLMEVMYRVWKDEGEDAGRAAYVQCHALPIIWIHESPELLKSAARLKALNPLSVADAWIAAAAMQSDAKLVHKDPEFEDVQSLLQERLPYK